MTPVGLLTFTGQSAARYAIAGIAG